MMETRVKRNADSTLIPAYIYGRRGFALHYKLPFTTFDSHHVKRKENVACLTLTQWSISPETFDARHLEELLLTALTGIHARKL